MSLIEWLPSCSDLVVSLTERRRSEFWSPISSTVAPERPLVSESAKTKPFIQLLPDWAAAVSDMIDIQNKHKASKEIAGIRFMWHPFRLSRCSVKLLFPNQVRLAQQITKTLIQVLPLPEPKVVDEVSAKRINSINQRMRSRSLKPKVTTQMALARSDGNKASASLKNDPGLLCVYVHRSYAARRLHQCVKQLTNFRSLVIEVLFNRMMAARVRH